MRAEPDVKWRPSRVQSTGLVAVGVLLAVLSVLAEKRPGPSWLTVVVAVCIAGSGVWLKWREGRAAAEDKQAITLATSSQSDLGSAGRLRTVGETGWEEFRVQPAAVELGYIPRDVQQDLHDRLVEGRPVLIAGHSMSGKTRMAYEVVRKLYREWQVWIPERPNGLAQLMATGVPQQTVVWLDDLEAFLGSENQLRLSWLTQLENAGCRVVATIRSSEYEKFQPVGEVKPPQWEVLKRFRLVWLLDNEEEQERIAASIGDEPIAAGIRRYGIAEYVGGGYLALDRFQNGQTSHPLAVAMLRAAADWRRLGFESIPEPTIRSLAPGYLPKKIRAALGEDDAMALKWASLEFGGRIKLLEPTGLGGWRIFDYLLDYLSQDESPIPDSTWNAAREATQQDPAQAYLLGHRAYARARTDLAAEFWQIAASVIPEAAYNLGVLRYELADLDAAADAFQLTIDSGHPDQAPTAAFNLGRVRYEQGDPDAAAAAFQLAIDSGHPDQAPKAAIGMGVLRQEQGDPDAAAAALQMAIDSGHFDHAPAAAFGMGVLRQEQGDPDAAAAAYQLAIDFGHFDHASTAAFNLGVLHYGQGDPDAAAAAYQLAIDFGHSGQAPTAAFNLGRVRYEQGDPDAAAAAFQLAIDSGHFDHAPKAAIGMGVVRYEQGDPDAAAAAYQLAIDSGHPDHAPTAAFNLGVLHQKQGDPDAAAAAYQLAIDSGHPQVAPAAAAALDGLRPV